MGLLLLDVARPIEVDLWTLTFSGVLLASGVARAMQRRPRASAPSYPADVGGNKPPLDPFNVLVGAWMVGVALLVGGWLVVVPHLRAAQLRHPVEHGRATTHQGQVATVSIDESHRSVA